MKIYAKTRKSFPVQALLCSVLVFSQSAASEVMPSWPDPLLVTEWLSRESTLARKFWLETSTEARLVSSLRSEKGNGPAIDPTRSNRPTPKGQSKPKSRAVELASIYGVGQQLAADVRIGGVLHQLRPQAGHAFASDQRGDDSIVAEQFSRGCLRLKYRKTQRRLCLSETDVAIDRDHDNTTVVDHVS